MAETNRFGQGIVLAALGLGAAVVGRRLLGPGTGGADLFGQVVLVTGGSRGLGFLLAREFGLLGCRVAICARDEQELQRARTDLEGHGIEVLTVRCDVSDRAQVERMVAEVTREWGGVDVLVNNAGIIQVGPIDTMTEADFQMAMGAMYWGVLYPVLAVLPQMRFRRSGRIVNITSIGARVSVPHLLPYNSAKFAAFGLSQGLRAELAREGITVTTIVPGLMRTGSHLKAYFKGRREWEYTWFALGASMPVLSMDAERAARQIVGAVRRGEATRVLSLPAVLLDRFSGLLPGTTANILGIVNRVLPGAGRTPEGAMEEGGSVHERMHSPVLSALTSWGLSAARRFQK